MCCGKFLVKICGLGLGQGKGEDTYSNASGGN